MGTLQCKREWLNAGWVCPAVYYRREYVHMLDGRYRAQTDDWDALVLAEDWDALVLAIHFEHYPPPPPPDREPPAQWRRMG